MRLVRFTYEETVNGIPTLVTHLWQVEGAGATLLLTTRCGYLSYMCRKPENAYYVRPGYGSLSPAIARLVWADYLRNLDRLRDVGAHSLPFGLLRTVANDLFLLKHGPHGFRILPLAEYPVVENWLETLALRAEGLSLARAA